MEAILSTGGEEVAIVPDCYRLRCLRLIRPTRNGSTVKTEFPGSKGCMMSEGSFGEGGGSANRDET